jgi:hypothetical protein
MAPRQPKTVRPVANSTSPPLWPSVCSRLPARTKQSGRGKSGLTAHRLGGFDRLGLAGARLPCVRLRAAMVLPQGRCCQQARGRGAGRLIENHDIEERKQTSSLAMECAITCFVAAELLTTVFRLFHKG